MNSVFNVWPLKMLSTKSILRIAQHKHWLAITFAYDHVVVRPSERSELPKESSNVEFLASEVSGPEILCDLHLYLAVELFLCSCCRRTLTCWCSRLASLVCSSLGPTQYGCWVFFQHCITVLTFAIFCYNIKPSYSSTYLCTCFVSTPGNPFVQFWESLIFAGKNL
jgi:hypothetical protein